MKPACIRPGQEWQMNERYVVVFVTSYGNVLLRCIDRPSDEFVWPAYLLREKGVHVGGVDTL